jgi:hypothetical protein
MAVWPKPNVTREQAPFLRAVRDRIESLERTLRGVATRLTAVEKSSSSSRQLTTRQVSELAELSRVSPAYEAQSDSAVGIEIGTDWSPLLALRVPTPAGRARAIVTATSTVNTVIAGPDLETRIVINQLYSTTAGRQNTTIELIENLELFDVDPDTYVRPDLVVTLEARHTYPISAPAGTAALAFSAVFHNR